MPTQFSTPNVMQLANQFNHQAINHLIRTVLLTPYCLGHGYWAYTKNDSEYFDHCTIPYSLNILVCPSLNISETPH